MNAPPLPPPPRRLRPPASLPDVVAGWQRHGRPDAVGFLTRHPELAADHSAVLYLAYEEFCLREKAGEFPHGLSDVARFVERFPTFRDDMVRLLHLHLMVLESKDLVAHIRAEPIWPEAGQTFLGFRLVRELGHGTFARVFLAREAAAGGRSVALKVSRQGGTEARTLGRLRHPNVVHVNSVTEDANGFIAVCMEYIDGVSLAAVCRRVFAGGTPSRASVFVTEGGSRTGLAALPYTDGCVRLGAQLADALAHLHQTGIVHGDLKPANVTLRADGQPVLIDFNLAFDPQAGKGYAGGTPAYMAPELLLAAAPIDVGVAALHRGLAAPADVFALGVILYELLTGRHPFGSRPDRVGPGEEVRARLLQAQLGGCRSLVGAVPGVDAALSRLVLSCLAFRPEHRPTAAAVAAGLNRYGSRGRRVGRWLRRHPRSLTAAVCGFVLVLAGAALSAPATRQPAAAPDRSALERGQAALAAGNSVEALRQFNRAVVERGDAEALLGRGRARIATGDTEAALLDLEQARRQTDDPRVHAALGFCCNLGPFRNHEMANDHYRKALAGNFANAAIHNNLAFGYLRQKPPAYTEAGEHLRLAVSLDPQLTAAWHNRAVLELELAVKDSRRPAPVDGVEHARKALALGPVTADLLRDAALLCAVASARSTDDATRTEFRTAALQYATTAVAHGLDPRMLRDGPLLCLFKDDPAYRSLVSAARPSHKPPRAVRFVNPLGCR